MEEARKAGRLSLDGLPVDVLHELSARILARKPTDMAVVMRLKSGVLVGLISISDARTKLGRTAATRKTIARLLETLPDETAWSLAPILIVDEVEKRVELVRAERIGSCA